MMYGIRWLLGRPSAAIRGDIHPPHVHVHVPTLQAVSNVYIVYLGLRVSKEPSCKNCLFKLPDSTPLAPSRERASGYLGFTTTLVYILPPWVPRSGPTVLGFG